MSNCEDCNSSFGYFGKATACHKCEKVLCRQCAGNNALIPFDTRNPEESNDLSRNSTVFKYCKKCFQQTSAVDLSKTFDVWEPSSEKDNGINFIMVPGGGSSRNMFLPHARELSKMGYRSILVDLPGHASLVDTPLTLDNCVETVRNILKSENCDPSKTIYVGASFGAYVGFYILDKLGSSFAAAILMDCGQNVGPDCSLKAAIGLWFMRKIGGHMTNEKLIKSMMGVAKKSKADYQLVEAVYGCGMYFQQASNLCECLHTVAPADHIPNFKFPVLYFNGSEDYRDSENKWLELCADQERSSLKVYEGGDHFFLHASRFVADMLERMDKFSKEATKQ
mmetsp:Transcript_20168/g.29938  ORF Transcript_20168/g.29938 Transcript_20168/m.29938 type:complete len:337 (+) Transcript_20168:72-1082(+)